ncbi:hypothetical protein GCM10010376_17100 [Streptomyces violaceusniger]
MGIPRTDVRVRGNHYTLMSEHADSTAGVIHDWLTGLSVPLTQREFSRGVRARRSAAGPCGRA